MLLLMDRMRLFVAIVPPAPAVAELDRQLAARRPAAGPGLRWTTPDAWHLTLAFLGEVPEPVLPELSTRLERAAGRHPAQLLAIRGAGAFPGPARARVLWAGIQPAVPPAAGSPGSPAPARPEPGRPEPGRPEPARPGPDRLGGGSGRALAALAASVAAGARRAGAPSPDEGRRFRPHLTLARLAAPADLRPLLGELSGLAGPVWEAADIRLIRSHLGGSPPGPPRYEEIARWPLRPPGQRRPGAS
jgi:2'-5' RNA ligase